MLFDVKRNDKADKHKTDVVLVIENLNEFAVLENLTLLLMKLHLDSMEGYLFLSNICLIISIFQYQNFG